jgi:hypothetical protein
MAITLRTPVPSFDIVVATSLRKPGSSISCNSFVFLVSGTKLIPPIYLLRKPASEPVSKGHKKCDRIHYTSWYRFHLVYNATLNECTMLGLIIHEYAMLLLLMYHFLKVRFSLIIFILKYFFARLDVKENVLSFKKK